MSKIPDSLVPHPSQVVYRSFADTKPEISLVERSNDIESIANAAIQQLAPKPHASLQDYRIVPKKTSFWQWLGSLFKTIFNLGAKNKEEDPNIKNRVLDAEVIGRIEMIDESLMSEYVGQSIQEAVEGSDIQNILHDLENDLSTKKAALTSGEELDLEFEERDGLFFPVNDAAKAAVQFRLKQLGKVLKENLDRFAQLDSAILLGTLSREFPAVIRLTQLIDKIDLKVSTGKITPEQGQALINAFCNQDETSRNLAIAGMKKSSGVALTLNELQEFENLSPEERDLITVLSNDVKTDLSSLTTPTVKAVVTWFNQFLDRHKVGIERHVKGQISKAVNAHVAAAYKLGGLENIHEVKNDAVNIKENIKAAIRSTIDSQLTKVSEEAKKKYPQLAAIKAHDEVFGSGSYEPGISDASISQLAGASVFAVEKVLQDSAGDIELDVLRKEYKLSQIRHLVQEIYVENYQAAHKGLAEKSIVYLDSVQSRVEEIIIKSIMYHAAEAARVENLRESERDLAVVLGEMIDLCAQTVSQTLEESLGVYPDLSDRQADISTSFSKDYIKGFVEYLLQQSTDSLYLEDQIKALGENQIYKRVEEKMGELVPLEMEKFLDHHLVVQMRSLQAQFPNETERKAHALENLTENQFTLVRTLTNKLTPAMQTFIGDELRLPMTLERSNYIQDLVQAKMNAKLDEMTEDALVAFGATFSSQRTDIENYRKAGINSWIDNRLNKLPKPPAGKNPIEVEYIILKTLVLNIESDPVKLTDDALASLEKEAVQLNKAYRKDHPTLLSDLYVSLSKESVKAALHEQLQERINLAKDNYRMHSNTQTEQFVNSYENDKVINRGLAKITRARIGNVENARKILKDEVIAFPQQIITDYKNFLNASVDKMTVSALAKKQIKEHFNDVLLEILARRLIAATVLSSLQHQLLSTEKALLSKKQTLTALKEEAPFVQRGMNEQNDPRITSLMSEIEVLKGEKRALKFQILTAHENKIEEDYKKKVYDLTEIEDDEAFEIHLRRNTADLVEASNNHLQTDIVSELIEETMESRKVE